MSHYLKSSPRWHVLFLPEMLVDAVSSQVQNPEESLNVQNIAKGLNLTHRELMEQQKEGLDQAQKAKGHQVALEIGENIDVSEQQEALKNFESKKGLRDNSGLGGTSNKHSYGNIHGPDVVGRNSNDHHAGNVDSRTNKHGGYRGDNHAEGGRPRSRPPVEHEYDVVRTPPTQRCLSEPGHRQEQAFKGTNEQAHRGTNEQALTSTNSPSSRPRDVDQHRERVQNYPIQDSVRHDRLHEMALQPFQNLDQDASSRSNLPTQENSVAAATGTVDDSFMESELTTGSLIQIPSSEPAGPWRYGTIKWIGLVPSIQGKVAGIELVSL